MLDGALDYKLADGVAIRAKEDAAAPGPEASTPAATNAASFEETDLPF